MYIYWMVALSHGGSMPGIFSTVSHINLWRAIIQFKAKSISAKFGGGCLSNSNINLFIYPSGGLKKGASIWNANRVHLYLDTEILLTDFISDYLFIYILFVLLFCLGLLFTQFANACRCLLHLQFSSQQWQCLSGFRLDPHVCQRWGWEAWVPSASAALSLRHTGQGWKRERGGR